MSKADEHEPVAIVGMGCRWPGGVESPAQFWEFLCNKEDGWREFSAPRFSSKGFYHPNADRPGGFSMKGAFPTGGDARLFDHAFFGMTKLEVETMDPSQRKLLEVAYEAIESAGETWESISGTRTGVFVGNFCLDHWMIQSRDWDNPRPYAFVGAGTSILANRISYIFNLQGPSLTIDTACSSSMYALHVAVNAMRAGDCDSAIVASANWIADPGVQIALDKLGALSGSSRCHTFDARADGYARGEGFGAIYLKTTARAMADRSPIRAMIRGSAMNSNGRTGGITRPSAAGQEAVIRAAYENAGLEPDETGYFECHGTGTYVGDPIEVAAVGRVFGSMGVAKAAPLLVGSVKSNVGHGEGASALAAIMKVVLALEHGVIPPVFDLATRNPNIDFVGAGVQPVTEVTAWPAGQLRRASINSFGYGGANAHCIVDHVNNVLADYVAPGVFGRDGRGEDACRALRASTTATTRQLVLLALSAHNEQSLQSNMEALVAVVGGLSLADVAYTFNVRRSRLAQRTFCVVERDGPTVGLQTALAALRAGSKPMRAPRQPTRLGFVFTGQGAQWHGMAAGLSEHAVFRRTVAHLDAILERLPQPPKWTLAAVLAGDCDETLVQTAAVAQAACTALQIGLVDLLASWSVQPAAVVGHSSGEMAAAYAAGRVSAAEAIVAAYMRGQAVSENRQSGMMLAVGLGLEATKPYLDQVPEGSVQVAAINGPGNVTLSGDTEAIETVATTLAADGIFQRRLQTGGNAYHSHHMRTIGQTYAALLATGDKLLCESKTAARSGDQQAVWFSSVTPERATETIGDFSAYWRSNLESPVQFAEAAQRMVTDTVDVLVEIGPHPAMKSAVGQILQTAGRTMPYAGTLRRGEAGLRSLLQLAGTLFTLNTAIDLAAVNAVDVDDGRVHGCTSTELPPYRYTYTGPNYHESRASREYRMRPTLRHDLLGSQVVGTALLRPQWRNILRLRDLPWLGDHRLLPDAVLPGAGYVALALEAAARMATRSTIAGFSLRDVAISASLVLPEDDYGVEILTTLELAGPVSDTTTTWATFSVSSVRRDTDIWTEHCTGSVRVETAAADETSLDDMAASNSATKPVSAATWYERFEELGLGYGPTFRSLSALRVDAATGVAMADLNLEPVEQPDESSYAVHPAALDGAIQLGLVAAHGGRTAAADTALVPVWLARAYVSTGTSGSGTGSVFAQGARNGVRSAELRLLLRRADGSMLMRVDGLRCVSYARPAAKADPAAAFASPFTRLVWQPDVRTLGIDQARKLWPPPAANVDQAAVWGVTNKLAHFVVLSLAEQFVDVQLDLQLDGERSHFLAWIQRRARTDRSPLMEEARQCAAQGRLREAMDELAAAAPHVREVQSALLLHDSMDDILRGRRSGVDVLVAADQLTPLYAEGLLMTGIYPQLRRLLASLAHAHPNRRVLEIGGGTGGATRVAMQAFAATGGIKAYHDYTFTDISAGFLAAARTSFFACRDMHFAVLDVETPPADQGFDEGQYDLVLACQVLHATADMHRTLTHCRRLLRPGGQLVLVETIANFIVPGVVVGTFTGYWAGIPDGRVDAPFQDLAAWDSALRAAGFSGLDIVLDDFPEPHRTTAVILSTVEVVAENVAEAPASVQLLYSSEVVPMLVAPLVDALADKGATVAVAPLADALADKGATLRAVVLLDDSALRRLADSNDPSDLLVWQHLARTASSLVVLTSCGTARGRNPDGALLAGLLRVLQTENPTAEYLCVDVDAVDFDVGAAALDLARVLAAHEARLQNPGADDREFVWQDGCLWVSRYVPDGGFHGEQASRAPPPVFGPIGSVTTTGPRRATLATPGLVASLSFAPYDDALRPPLRPGQITVAVAAAGLGPRDLDRWTGRADSHFLSCEYAGTVLALAPDVVTNRPDLSVGCLVYGLGLAHFGTAARVPAALARPLPPTADLLSAAALAFSATTAVYALDHVARLRRHHAVLVQSATHDAGPALVRLAVARGALVFATVHTDQQARYVSEQLHLPLEHIAISSPSALHQLAQLTPKCAFDVIVHSTGTTATTAAVRNSLLDTLQVLAPLGHLVDLSRADAPVTSISTIGPELLPRHASYSAVDLLFLLREHPDHAANLLAMAHDAFRADLLVPAPAATIVPVSQCAVAATTLASATDAPVGRLVVHFHPTDIVRLVPTAPAARFDPNAAYIVTGGLGGLGQTLVRWMASAGARHITVLARRDPIAVPGASALLSDCTAAGVDILWQACDVADAAQVAHAVSIVTAQRPLRGLVHAAVSYCDYSFDGLSVHTWQAGLAAKVAGTRILHDATRHLPLDFFVMTTSALSLYGFATQAAYTAANRFQDAFARYRRSLGLPASAVSLGLVAELTTVGSTDRTIHLFARNQAQTHGPDDIIALLEPAFLGNQTAHSAASDQWRGQADDPLSAANLHAYLDPHKLAAAAATATAPSWHADGRVALMLRALRDARSAEASATAAAHSPEGPAVAHAPALVRNQLDAAVRVGPDGRAGVLSLVQTAISTAVAAMLFVDPDGVDPTRSVADLGVDSLIAAELRTWFLQALATSISMLDLLDPAVSIAARAAAITDAALQPQSAIV